MRQVLCTGGNLVASGRYEASNLLHLHKGFAQALFNFLDGIVQDFKFADVDGFIFTFHSEVALRHSHHHFHLVMRNLSQRDEHRTHVFSHVTQLIAGSICNFCAEVTGTHFVNRVVNFLNRLQDRLCRHSDHNGRQNDCYYKAFLLEQNNAFFYTHRACKHIFAVDRKLLCKLRYFRTRLFQGLIVVRQQLGRSGITLGRVLANGFKNFRPQVNSLQANVVVLQNFGNIALIRGFKPLDVLAHLVQAFFSRRQIVFHICAGRRLSCQQNVFDTRVHLKTNIVNIDFRQIVLLYKGTITVCNSAKANGVYRHRNHH